ncbi:MAG: MauE/DoxX family redox-associated membrane protein [Actinocatenispora sp.]
MLIEEATEPRARSVAYWRGFDRTGPGSWTALVLRLGLAAIWLIFGLSKITDLDASVQAVGAYKLFPYAVAVMIGSAQPIIEVLIGVALLVGLAVRLAATISAVLFVVYIGGIISVWARGLRIDCGCFSSGGALAAGESTNYGWDILRDVGFLVLALLVILWSRSRFSLDNLLFYSSEADVEDTAEDEDE